MPTAREVMDRETSGRATRELAQSVVDSGFVPEVVVAVARGGLPAGGAIAYALGTKAVATLDVGSYPGVDGQLTDTGEPRALVRRLLVQHCVEVRTAVLNAKPRSVLDPDLVWRRTDRRITFPWSALPPVTRASDLGPPLAGADG